jgi:heme/copper-type cytochrome/quinol oxidase subunit 1
MVVIPSAIQVFAWSMTIVRRAAALPHAAALHRGFIFMFVIGGLTGSCSSRSRSTSR